MKTCISPAPPQSAPPARATRPTSALQGMRGGLRLIAAPLMRVQSATGVPEVAMQCAAHHASWEPLIQPTVAAAAATPTVDKELQQHKALGSQHVVGKARVVVSPLPGASTVMHDLAPPVRPAQPRQASTLIQYQHTGMLEVITGPMFAGKTTELIKRARQAQAEGLQVLCLKSNKDTRYAVCSIATHTGDQLNCHPTHDLMSVPSQLAAQYQQAQVIVLDEAQFFSDLTDFVQLATDQHQKILIVAGLDGDFKRQRFGQLLDVIPMADKVTKLHTHCYVHGCMHPAIFSKRTTQQLEQELVGGADKYVACCRKHYLNSPLPHRSA